MSQRGGDVQSNLRISSSAIRSDLIPRGAADLIVSMEPMEALRYLPWLADDGWVITGITPLINIPNYPEGEALRRELEELAARRSPRRRRRRQSRHGAPLGQHGAAGSRRAAARNRRREAGSPASAPSSPARAGQVVETNLAAFHAGYECGPKTGQSHGTATASTGPCLRLRAGADGHSRHRAGHDPPVGRHRPHDWSATRAWSSSTSKWACRDCRPNGSGVEAECAALQAGRRVAVSQHVRHSGTARRRRRAS